MKKIILNAFIIVMFLNILNDMSYSNKLLPDRKEMPGDKNHWLVSIEPIDKTGKCEILSATYTYFANESQKLFDITREKIYSVNTRIHICDSLASASKLYDKFYSIGDEDEKQDINLGEKGFIYITPTEKDSLHNNFYLNSLNGSTVLQIHSDDGFILMDMADIILPKIKNYLLNHSSNESDITLLASKKGYDNSTFKINIKDKNIEKIDLKGFLYDTKNIPIVNVRIVVLETGKIYHTDKNGAFEITLGNPEAQGRTIFYTNEMTEISNNKILESGYYEVDMHYIKNGKSTKDHWRLNINSDGNINGLSLNPTTDTILQITGIVDDQTVIINRICNIPINNNCIQKFEGKLEGDFIKGNWNGIGGGGLWRLYIKSFELANEILPIEKAGITIERIYTKQYDNELDEEILLKGDNDIIVMLPSEKKEDNFYYTSAHMIIELNNLTAATNNNLTSVNRMNTIYFYSDSELKKMLASIPFTPSQKVVIDTDISSLYIHNKIKPYYISFKNNITAKLKANIKLTYAKNINDDNNHIDGIFKIIKMIFNADDIAGDRKEIIKNENDDILLELLLEGYKKTIEEIKIQAIGKRKVEWSTKFGDIYPGVAVITEDGTILNNPNGDIRYIIDKYSEKIYLSIDQGPLTDEDIEKIIVTIKFSNGHSVYEYYVSK